MACADGDEFEQHSFAGGCVFTDAGERGSGDSADRNLRFPGRHRGGDYQLHCERGQFSGSDCGAKINSADASLGSTSGEIDVNQACGATLSTAVTLSASHNLVWTQAGTYTVNEISLAGNNIVDLRGAELQIAAYSVSGTPPNAGMFTTYNGSSVASNVLIENGALDGNASNITGSSYPSNTCLEGQCRAALRIGNGGTAAAPHDIRTYNVKFQNWTNPAIYTDNTYPLPYNIILDTDVFDTVGPSNIVTEGFDHTFVVRNSRFRNWGSSLNPGVSTHADPFYAQDNTAYPGTSMFDLDIENNIFEDSILQPDGNSFVTEAPIGGYITGLTFDSNVVLDDGPGQGGCLSTQANGEVVTGNYWAGIGACELTGNAIAVTGNTIVNGNILVYASPLLSNFNSEVSGNTINESGTNMQGGPTEGESNQKAIMVSGWGSESATLTQAIRQTALSFSQTGGTLTSITFNPQTASGTPPEMVVNGTFSGGSTNCASNACANWAFTLAQANNGNNNGTFICTASTATALTFVNPRAISETLPSGATLVSSASTTDYVGAYSFGGFNGLAGQTNIATTGFTNSGNNSTSLTAIANSPTVLAVTNSSGVYEPHAAMLTVAPGLYNVNVGPDSINLGESTGSCVGVALGFGSDGQGPMYNTRIHNVSVTGQPGAGIDCSGIETNIAGSSSIPLSSGFDISDNTVSNMAYGLRLDNLNSNANDFTVESNKVAVGITAPIYLPTAPSVYRAWNNVTSSTQTVEDLNGGATVDASGDISSPGWVSGGVNIPSPADGAVTWSSAVAVNVVTLSGNVTSSTIANGAFAGQQVCFSISQGSSVYSIVWPSNMQGMSQPSQSSYYTTYQCAVYLAAGSTWQALAPAIDGLGNTYLPGTVNAPAIVDRGLTSASLIGTNSSGTLVAASTTGTGNAVLANGPTFTGNTTTFANGAAAELDVVIQPGTGADQVGAFEFNNYAGTSEWKLRKDASNYFKLTDVVNSLDREVLYPNGQTLINSGAGANSVLINSSTGSGTGGFYVESGGSSPAAVFSTTGSGNTTATGFVSGKFMMGSGTMSLGAGAAAGTSPTIGCASGHVCDGVSGTVTLTTGTSTTTGTLATLSFPNTHSNSANCVVTPMLSGAGLVTSINWSESTTALTLTANTALTASTAYQIRYWCGGN